MKDMLDKYGYPTDTTLTKIAEWPSKDSEGWFQFIQSIWNFADWGWGEIEKLDSNGNNINSYSIYTMGWSGNEDVIRAMQKNDILWLRSLISTRHGGHYIFQRKINNEHG